MPVFLLSEKIAFPPPHFATPEGLLAVGGDLSQERLLLAYRMGIFPWYSEEEPILWWSPDPRLILYPSALHVSRTLKKIINKKMFTVTIDRAFEEVITACAQTRLQNREGTWIVDGIQDAYCRLHLSGYAHSVETWTDGRLAGGLYGVSLGRCFFGESMFSRVDNASSIVRHLATLSFDFIDCQVTTAHLKRFGACEIPRSRFLKELRHALTTATLKGQWKLNSMAEAGIAERTARR
jgi:leucyl/phenylalanyl-tRNA--protein transferase